MSAQTFSETISTPRFTPLDVIGISVSTLLFTVVWVGVFSAFLPERTNMVFSDSFKQVRVEQAQEGKFSLQTNLVHAKERIVTSVRYGVTSLLSVVQAGGSARNMTTAFRESVFPAQTDPLVRVFPTTAVLGAATKDVLVESQVPEAVFQQSYIYINTVTFGLLGQINQELDVAMGLDDSRYQLSS